MRGRRAEGSTQCSITFSLRSSPSISRSFLRAEPEAGATGGTIVRAKGALNESRAKFFGVSIAEEKDVVYIVASADKRNDIMSAIMNKAGVKSPAHTVMFSLPVDAVAGIHVPDSEQDQDE